MKKTFNIEVDCANCALKVEQAIKNIVGVNNCSINFMTQKMNLEAEDIESLLPEIKKVAKKVEPDFEIEE